MTAVYDAYASRQGFENVKLQMDTEMDKELFAEYVEVEPDAEKAEKVLRTIRRELGLEAYECICQAAASWDKRKANAIFKTVVLGLHLPKKQQVMNCLTKDYVCTVADLAKKTWNEAHRFMGFVRFSELAGGILYADIKPENEVLPFIAPHFANRYPEENWIIYDSVHHVVAVHPKYQKWFLTDDVGVDYEKIDKATQDGYVDLWKLFVDTIAIEERRNERCQNNHMPKWYRKNMTEWK